MFSRKIPLFKLFGFKVGIDLTWLIIAFFVAWSLAKGLFPEYFEGLSNATYWWMGVAGALGLFFSIVFHEFCHSVVARRYGMEMSGITLFLFGGVAEMKNEPQSPMAEFTMAIAGPLSSLLLAGIAFGGVWLAEGAGVGTPVTGVLRYMVWLNVILAIFNMVPAFPLDGGRILRSILWGAKKDLRWATKIASTFGSAFGMFLIVLGVLAFVGGNFVAGVWYFLIGLFIRGAARTSYSQMMIQNMLAGEPIERLMQTEPVTVPTATSVSDLVENYFYRYHHKLFPVADNGHLSGCVTAEQIREIPREQWSQATVETVARPCSQETTISIHSDALEAMQRMKETGQNRLMVMDQDRLAGTVTLRDISGFLAIKLDIEGEKSKSPIPDMKIHT